MKKIILVLSFLFTGSLIFAQSENEIIAKMGDKVITLDEFKYRYEFTPQINRKYNDRGKAKEDLLYTLISEHLFALEAESMGFDTLEAIKRNFIPLEKMHVRDALYKERIGDKVELNLEKFNEGLKLSKEKLFVDFIYSIDEQGIRDAHKIISSNSNFDSLVTLIKNAEYVSEPYEVSYGKMYYKAEEAVYNLNLFQFTEPLESPDGWYIFRLLNRIPVTYKSIEERNSRVKKVVEDRVADSIYNDFWNDFFSDKKITTDGLLFWYFVDEMHELISKIKLDRKISDGEKITVTNEDFAKLKLSLNPDSLKREFIRFDEEPLTFGQFVDDLSFEGFYTNSIDKSQLAAQLNSRLRRQIELELLARDAYKSGMDNLPDVKLSTQVWKENYLSTLYMKDIVLNTKLDDSDLKKYLSEQMEYSVPQTKVNIIEILTDSLEVVKDALSLSENTEAFRNFAVTHTKRELTKQNNGEFGEFSILEYGEIGKIAGTMEIGDVYGPLELDSGYSVFKVIEKKENQMELDSLSLDEETRRLIKYRKIKDHLENLAADLAEKYNLTINNELLNSLDLLNAQMVVFRYMGFGGRILAYPYTSPFFEWKEKWEQKKKDLL